MIEMVDGEERDEKIIAVPLGDPNYNYMFDISQLPAHVLEEMGHFFTVYKSLEGKETVVRQATDRDHAVRAISQAIERYNEKYVKGEEKA